MDSNDKFTIRQVYFYVGKQKLKKYDLILRCRKLTSKEIQEKDYIYLSLWSQIRRYAFNLVKKYATGFVTPDTHATLEQNLFEVFMRKLKDYDPLLSKPTTFYKPYFMNTIANELNPGHLSAYDRRNIKKVNAAIESYEARGIDWTIEMISVKSGLSTKVVTKTIHFSQNQTYAKADALSLYESDLAKPEQELLCKESSYEIWKRIEYHIKAGDFTKEAFNLFALRENQFTDPIKIPYQEIADRQNITLLQLRSSLNQVRCVLQRDPFLRRMNAEKAPLSLSEGISLCYSISESLPESPFTEKEAH